MSEKIDFDAMLVKYLGFKNHGEYEQFFAHFLLHSTLTFLFLSIWWPLGFLSLTGALVKELWNDGHWRQWDRDGTQDMLARGLGSLLPFITLIWN